MADAIIPLKTCTKCRAQFSKTTEFFSYHIRRGRKDWRSWCKRCTNENRRMYFRKLRDSRQCKVSGCTGGIQTIKDGLCAAHRRRFKLYGDPIASLPRKPYGVGHVNKYGYRMMSKKNNEGGFINVPQHRLIMERHLGRTLLKNENVHHINGDRIDNRIQNLELWVVRQPHGQRAEDLVSYAREILSLYEKKFGKQE